MKTIKWLHFYITIYLMLVWTDNNILKVQHMLTFHCIAIRILLMSIHTSLSNLKAEFRFPHIFHINLAVSYKTLSYFAYHRSIYLHPCHFSPFINKIWIKRIKIRVKTYPVEIIQLREKPFRIYKVYIGKS